MDIEKYHSFFGVNGIFIFILERKVAVWLIDIFIRRSGDHFYGWRVEGHAGYSEPGKDIVCAAVSALTITLENALVRLLHISLLSIQYIDEGPYTTIQVPSDKTDLLIKSYLIGVQGVEDAYPDYVKIHLET